MIYGQVHSFSSANAVDIVVNNTEWKMDLLNSICVSIPEVYLNITLLSSPLEPGSHTLMDDQPNSEDKKKVLATAVGVTTVRNDL